jgi:hypothetical protein
MANIWLSALKEYNRGKSSWCIPKKGTPEYKKVRLSQTMKRSEKDKSGKKSKLEDAMRRAKEDM